MVPSSQPSIISRIFTARASITNGMEIISKPFVIDALAVKIREMIEG